jgi:hypothetical protein
MTTPMNGPVSLLAGQLKEMQARITQLERNQRSAYNLQNASIDGGALLVNDVNGNTRQVIGSQPDGTVTIVEAGANPPLTPDTPVVAAQISSLVIGWDGLLGGFAPLSDFLYTEVHLSTTSGFTPDTTTLQRTMQAGGIVTIANLTPGTTYYAVLVGVNRSRTSSVPSTQTPGVPLNTTQTIPAGSITPGLLSFSAGGQTTSVGSTTPASPAVNDLWFDTGNGGVLKQWNGSAWTPYQFGTGAISANAITTAQLAAGAVTAAQILAGTITATQIATGTITASLLQTGIVVAGIINGTVVTGSTVQNSSSDPRTSINPDGSITITNAAGVVVFKIGPDGTVYWYTQGGTLLMTLAPGGTQAIYTSQTGPAGCQFEPPSSPNLLFTNSSVTAATIYTTTLTANVPAGSVVTVVASVNSTTTPATTVTDTKGNTYTLLTSQATVSPQQYVFQAVNVAAMSTSDTISVTFSVSNTAAKNIIAISTSGVPTVSPLDFQNTATGTSTAPSVAGTPTMFGEALIFILSNGTPAGPTAVLDGYQQIGQTSISGGQSTTVYYSTSITPSASVTASATLGSSLAWNAVILGYKDATVQAAPVPTAATFSPSTQWSDDGNFSCKVTKVGTATSWGITFQPFPVQPNSAIAARIVFGTLNIALGAVQIGFTWWSGPNGTGTNLGSAYWAYGAMPASVFQTLILYNAIVPAGAQSATFYAMENQADTAGNWFLIDNLSVPGGLAYSNSPYATQDTLGNPIPQGINFFGVPGVTNVFGVEDPYQGQQLLSIDGSGNLQGQTITAATDLVVGGSSVPNDLIAPLPLGIVNYGYKAIGATAWPGTAIGGTEVALFQLDQVCQTGHIYEFVMNPTIINVTAAGAMHLHLRYTQDGSTPTTSSAEACMMSSRVESAGTDAGIGPIRCVFGPYSGVTTIKVLITGHAGSGTYQFKNDDFVRCMFYDLGANMPGATNNLVVYGSGSSGGASPQQYTEYFYGNNTWTYWEYGQRNHNGTIYQGAYSGEGYAQYCYVQFSMGSRGNALNTVLNYQVNSVKFRLLNQHSWYNSGATVSFHASTALGSLGGALTSELDSWHINEGQMLNRTLGSSAWSPFKAGGVTYAVLRPPGGSLSLDYYSYFWGGGNNNSNVPAMIVTYTH